MAKLRIAVVGSGISGLGAAWLLGRKHDVTLIERDERIGGHSNTQTVATADGDVPVDTGFIVYNVQSYPNLVAFFAALGVATAPTNMSFAVSLDDGGYEYSGSGIAGLFGQPSNIWKSGHWRMAAGILRFFREARALADAGDDHGLSLGAWLAANGHGPDVIERHILPMGAAIWSTPSRRMLEFPALAFARFFANHGLLQLRNRPAWRTVRGGSRTYVAAALKASGAEVVRGLGAAAIRRFEDGVEIQFADGTARRYDHVVIAAHADDALALLADPDALERGTLSAFRYVANRAVLHRDPRLMPARRRLWSSWNFIGTGDGRLAVSYWMNRLQPLATTENLFLTLNPPEALAPGAEIAEFDYRHPMFDRDAIRAQPDLWTLQGRRRTWFCGSYFGYGFHEDGLQAGLAVAEALGGVRRPWTVPNESGRIHLSSGFRAARRAEPGAVR
jgi:predicted NAD/FAD-binding protein